jgi:4-hydroxy-tetrahydrodipicolinate reductase
MKAIRLAVAGAAGRMGRTLVRLAAADARFQVVAALVEPGEPAMGRDAGAHAGIEPLGVPLSARSHHSPDVLIEFTNPAGTRAWAAWCAQHEVALVSGTTGLRPEDQAQLRAAAERVPVLWAANMSLGVALLRRLAAQLAAWLDESWDVEIVEAHHRAKSDAPSGTARALLDALGAARAAAKRTPPTIAHGRQGPAALRAPGEIGMHAVRLGGIVGDHAVHFASADEMLTLHHRALSRDLFAAGALRAAAAIVGRPPKLYTIDELQPG